MDSLTGPGSGIARTTLRAVLPAYGMGELLDTAELSASELVTNAYRHTKGPAALRLPGLDWLDGEARSGVRVTVWDTDSYVPSPFDKPPVRTGSPGVTVAQPDQRSLGGRGLLLVRGRSVTGRAHGAPLTVGYLVRVQQGARRAARLSRRYRGAVTRPVPSAGPR